MIMMVLRNVALFRVLKMSLCEREIDRGIQFASSF